MSLAYLSTTRLIPHKRGITNILTFYYSKDRFYSYLIKEMVVTYLM
jgi:hypothetical protein